MSESLISIIDSHQTIFGFLNHGKTGMLQSYPDDRKLYFENGHLIYASSDVPGEHFSDFLVLNDIVDRSKLGELRAGLQPGESLGKKLKQEGLASPKDLAHSLKQQITTVVERMIADIDGSIIVHDDPLPPKMPRLKIQTIGIFARAIFRLDGDQLLPGFNADWFVRLGSHAENQLALHEPSAALAPVVDTLRQNHSLTAQALAESQDWNRDELKLYLYLLKALEWLDAGSPTSGDILDDDVLESHDLLEIDDNAEPDSLATVLPEHNFTQESLQADAATWQAPKAADQTVNEPQLDIQEPDPPTAGDPYAELTDDSNIHLDLTSELLKASQPSESESLPANEAEILEQSSAYLEQKVFDAETEGMELDTIPPGELEAERALMGTDPSPHLFDDPVEPPRPDHQPFAETVPSLPIADLTQDQGWQPPFTPQEQINPEVSFLGESELTPTPSIPSDVILPDQNEEHVHDSYPKKSGGSAKWLLAALVLVAIAGTAYFFISPMMPFTSETDQAQLISEDPAPSTPTDSTTGETIDTPTLPSDEGEPSEPDHSPTDRPTEGLETTDPSVVDSQPEAPRDSTPPQATQPPSTMSETSATGNSLEQIIQMSIDDFQTQGARYSLAFIVACQKETVQNVQQAKGSQDIFIFPRALNGKPCYLVSWGAFATKAEARQALKRFPRELKKLSDSQWVVAPDTLR